MVMAPSAISSCWCSGLILDPQLSDPTQRKWPTWSALLAAARICLWRGTLKRHVNDKEQLLYIDILGIKQKENKLLFLKKQITGSKPKDFHS